MWAFDMALQKSEESMNFNLDREPRRHLNADFKIEKEKRPWTIVHGGQKIESAKKIHACIS